VIFHDFANKEELRVGWIQEASKDSRYLAIPNDKVDSAHENSALTNLKEHCLSSSWLLDRYQPLHKGMRMSAGDEVNPIDLSSNL
jgi:hypothetical protein